jgi:adenylosuccinate synthase
MREKNNNLLMKAKIVLGTQFGDEGKGITTDYLCSLPKRPKKCVVRFSGGHQAGHTVVVNGKKHVFSSIGSGSFRGIPTYISEHCTIYPPAFVNEVANFQALTGITPQIVFHPKVMLTTPYDIAYNRLSFSEKKPSTVGLGVGATMKRNLETPVKLWSIHTSNDLYLTYKLSSVMRHYAFETLHNSHMVHSTKDWIRSVEMMEKIISHGSYECLTEYDELIFEGSQGILLDQDWGIFPHVTYGKTTGINARKICNTLGIDDIDVYYAARCYQTRHGNGYMSRSIGIKLINNEDETNISNKYQGNFRVTEFDYKLINMAIGFDECDGASNDTLNMVITCLDQRPDFLFDSSLIKHPITKVFTSKSPDSRDFEVYAGNI